MKKNRILKYRVGNRNGEETCGCCKKQFPTGLNVSQRALMDAIRRTEGLLVAAAQGDFCAPRGDTGVLCANELQAELVYSIGRLLGLGGKNNKSHHHRRTSNSITDRVFSSPSSSSSFSFLTFGSFRRNRGCDSLPTMLARSPFALFAIWRRFKGLSASFWNILL